ncbi:CBS domain-containing protein [Streptomyces sp. NPDC001595]|uniref:CBS domain-containing protein n=1 Tax=Streptomyces sp. NPDC001532 TaxID=3154520 RepID=UPI003330355E
MSATPHLVADVLPHTVVALRREATFTDIVRTMRREHTGALPVLDGAHRVLGVVSEADLLPREESGAPLRRPPVTGPAGAVTAEQLMTVPAVTVPVDATLSEAARTMVRHGLKLLPVVDGEGTLRGVLSRADLLAVFLRDDEDIAEDIRRQVVAPLFPALPEPVEVRVHRGLATLSGRVADAALIPVAARLTEAVEGVELVDCALLGPVEDQEHRAAAQRRAAWSGTYV